MAKGVDAKLEKLEEQQRLILEKLGTLTDKVDLILKHQGRILRRVKKKKTKVSRPDIKVIPYYSSNEEPKDDLMPPDFRQ